MAQPISRPAKRPRANRGPLFLVIAGVILVILAAVFALLRPGSTPAGSFVPEVKGAPNIQADKDRVDLGDQKLGSTVEVSFTITNTGDQPLRFTEQPYVEVKEGC